MRELAGGEGAPLRLVLDGARSGEEVLRAGVVSPGVEIAVGRETLRFDRKRSERARRDPGGPPGAARGLAS